ncbi:photosystem II assembly protein [Oscillatoria sp. FACHB-1406]|uniref:photosystem II assembly protein n=1 Tax=Oscillatoria sp. FACHB-1406 TaxID=2692846 RepID=UPI001684780F|nr:photosystem II assembly protein [Oscillatoria sp. FACHB-1406]MBD2580406.1 photosystem II assembly protein [Oscillatoria sp. FACHB-1406]
MSNIFNNWLRSRRFRQALEGGKLELAETIFREIEQSRAPLSLLERVYRKQLYAEQDLKSRLHENISLRGKVQQQIRKIEDLDREFKRQSSEVARLEPSPEFIEFVTNRFQLSDRESPLLKCTGIDEQTFDDFEHRLAVFIQKELKKQNPQQVAADLSEALQDLEVSAAIGDPKYDLKLSSYAYLIRDFLDNIYCNYIAWYLIYEAGLIPEQLRILDLAAGPGTVAYGLMLLLRSSIDFFPMPSLHISYYSLEKQALLQFRGLQFWRQYIDTQNPALNIYFRFDTTDLFDYPHHSTNISQGFFNFVVVSHCFFSNTKKRLESYKIYKNIFREKLAPGGYVLLIVKGEKLFEMYGVYPTDDLLQEQNIIQCFLEELDLKLEWYKYLSSTGKRRPYLEDEELLELPKKKYINALKQQYLASLSDSRYFLADYAILARYEEKL